MCYTEIKMYSQILVNWLEQTLEAWVRVLSGPVAFEGLRPGKKYLLLHLPLNTSRQNPLVI